MVMKSSVRTSWKWSMILLLAIPFLLFSCEKSTGTATMRARLTDAPGDFEAVNIDVQEVKVYSDANGWQNLATDAGIYNLLEFNNGMDVIIADGSLPAGNVSQMRMVLGTNNSVKVDGQTYPLTVPSGAESGLKFNIHENLQAGVHYEVWIDFDAGRSVVLTGSGTYSLKPVIRTYTAANSGAITGTVAPASAHPYVMAVKGSDTLSTYAEPSGYFLLSGAPAGTYTVTITATGYLTITISDVNVTIGNVTQMGTITLSP